jgi:hypothetical protein
VLVELVQYDNHLQQIANYLFCRQLPARAENNQLSFFAGSRPHEQQIANYLFFIKIYFKIDFKTY